MKAESGDARLAWQRRLAPMLLPAAWCYSGIQRARRYAYRRGFMATVHCGKPVVSIGSLLAGGSGKTPFVAHVAGRLARHNTAILSRGFGREAAGPLQVGADSDPRQCGDEPLLLARTTPAAVWVDPRRAHLARRLARDYDLFILDDGYQHLGLHRDLNVCLLPDLPRGAVLPAGLWREGPTALRDADFVVGVDDLPGWLRSHYGGPTARVEFVPGEWRTGQGPVDAPARALAFCGIARPERFLASLDSIELTETVLFRDHHFYTQVELDALWERARRSGAEALVTTAKDAVRIRSAPADLPLLFRDVTLRWITGEREFMHSLTGALGVPAVD